MLSPTPFFTDLSIATGPVVASPAPMLRDVDVLLVVELGEGRVEDAMDHPRLKVKQDSTGNVMLVISLENRNNINHSTPRHKEIVCLEVHRLCFFLSQDRVGMPNQQANCAEPSVLKASRAMLKLKVSAAACDLPIGVFILRLKSMYEMFMVLMGKLLRDSSLQNSSVLGVPVGEK